MIGGMAKVGTQPITPALSLAGAANLMITEV